MARGGGLADHDALTHTVAGQPFVHATWLASAALYRVFALGGYPLLQMLLALSTTATLLLIAASAHRASRGNPSAMAAATILGAWLLLQNLGMRPQLFALPLFAFAALLLLTVRPGRGVLAGAATVTACLANLHGAFVLVPILAGALAMGAAWERERRDAAWLSATALACALATLATPYGFHLYGYVHDNMAVSMDRSLEEWRPTWRVAGASLRLVSSVAIVAVVAWRRRALPPRRWLPALAAFLALAISGERYVVWMAMLLPAALAHALPLREEDPPRRLAPGYAFALVLFFVPQLAILSPWWRTRALDAHDAVAAQFEPGDGVMLAEWAAAHGAGGRLFNPMEWGGWLEWRLDAKAFVDVRVWIYPDPVWSDFRSASAATPGWEETLDRYAVETAFLDRRFDRALLAAMAKSERWEKLYEDADGAIYRRRRALPSP